jgi:hypothetical protein
MAMFDCQPVSSDSAAVRTHFGFWKATVDAVAQQTSGRVASLQDILQEEQFPDCHPLSGCTFGVGLCSFCLRKAGIGNGATTGCEAVTKKVCGGFPKGSPSWLLIL